jgi:hypothetical protein
MGPLWGTFSYKEVGLGTITSMMRTAATKHRSMSSRAWAVTLAGLILLQPVFAQSESEEPIDNADDAEELEDLDIDVQGSLDDVEEKRGIAVDGDLRLGYVFAGEDIQGITSEDSGYLQTRWRLRSTWGISERFRAVGRVSGICSTTECDPDFILQPDISTQVGLSDGQITIDSLFFQWFRTEKFNVAVGRMETKLVARGGVYAKSLDRNDSNNLRINWTDGLHATYKAKNGWNSNLILQYNSSDGPSNIRRSPLDFSESGSRVSTVVGFENVQPKRRLVQRALDINYLPSSLKKNGIETEPAVDYWAVVARAAARWPMRSEGWRLRFSSEVGYAPETPTKLASGIVGSGDVGGLAWNVTASIMEFLPNHSIGVNYAETEAGWLISPQYADNERLWEIRYMWRPTERLTLDVRGRWRDELIQRIVDDPDRDRFDFYARFTWSFTAKRFVN